MSMLTYRRGNVTWVATGKGRSGYTFREHGPAHITPSGTVIFSQLSDTANNRKRGPAIIQAFGVVSYTNILGQAHRTDGPAIIYSNNHKEYWVDGEKLELEEFFIKYGVL